ncbi:MAG TPA: hypothetical protein VIU11_00555 [Nakamurella sp.]
MGEVALDIAEAGTDLVQGSVQTRYASRTPSAGRSSSGSPPAAAIFSKIGFKAGSTSSLVSR